MCPCFLVSVRLLHLLSSHYLLSLPFLDNVALSLAQTYPPLASCLFTLGLDIQNNKCFSAASPLRPIPHQNYTIRRFSSPPLSSPKLYDQNLQQRFLIFVSLQLRWVMAIGEAGIEILRSVLWASFLAQSLRFLVKEGKGKKNQQRWRCLCFRRRQRRKGLTSSSNPRVTEKFPSSSWNRLAKVELLFMGLTMKAMQSYWFC
ncbi:uncharacterized protein [Coffea arabica]|uniref:Uncharacterized protein isoform X3 n=1 Tax=Coffea arabica TaxID=13443 RepID=A0ABM4UZW5_COFAR